MRLPSTVSMNSRRDRHRHRQHRHVIHLPPQRLRTQSIVISTELTVNPGHLCLHRQVLTCGSFFSYCISYNNIQVVLSRSIWTIPSPCPLLTYLTYPPSQADTCSLLWHITPGAPEVPQLTASGNWCCWEFHQKGDLLPVRPAPWSDWQKLILKLCEGENLSAWASHKTKPSDGFSRGGLGTKAFLYIQGGEKKKINRSNTHFSLWTSLGFCWKLKIFQFLAARIETHWPTRPAQLLFFPVIF